MSPRWPWRLAAALGVLVLSVTCFAGRHELARKARGLPPYTHRVLPMQTEWVSLPDGVRLRTELFRPRGLEQAPAVFIRNPYDLLVPILRVQCGMLARYGYACALQSVRGRAGSEGEWIPLVNEREDGLAALRWLVQQPWVDGNVALYGASYLAWTQWSLADQLPPEVKTLIPAVYGLSTYDNVYERGLMRHDLATAWATLMPDGQTHLRADDAYIAAARHQPALEADERYMGGRLDWYREWQRASSPGDPYWTQPPGHLVPQIPPRVSVPALMVGGWFDPFLYSQLWTFGRLGGRADSVLLIGPWNHIGRPTGDLESPLATGGLEQWPLMLEWLDHHLRGAPLRTLTPGEVRTLAPNDDQWRRRPGWPPPAEGLTLHLGDAARAQSCAGGSLSPNATAGGQVEYVYDPAQPNPTRGGASLLSFLFFRTVGPTPGPVDQGDSCAREDVLSFRGEVLPAAMRLVGAPRLTLTVRSTAPDTAFVARLIAEQPEGAVLIREAAATLALPTVQTLQPAPYTPGEERTVELDFWPIEWVAPAGSRLRLDLSSSSFPALAVHANRAGPWAEQTASDPATQTILVGEGRSTLVLQRAVE